MRKVIDKKRRLWSQTHGRTLLVIKLPSRLKIAKIVYDLLYLIKIEFSEYFKKVST